MYNVATMIVLRTLVLGGVLASVCLAGGCGQVGQIYSAVRDGPLGADISAKGGWQLGGDLYSPAAAADENLSTAARSDYEYTGAVLTVDLRQACLFQTIIIDHGSGEHGYAGKVSVATSIDGKVFVNQHVAPGTRRVTVLSLPQPVLARHVRLRAVTAGARPWNIAELYLR